MPNIITVRPAAAIIEGVTVDDRTPLGFPLPHKDNSPRQGDIDRLRDALLMIDALFGGVDGKVSGIVSDALAALIGAAPGALNTVEELAAALGNDPNKITTIMTQLGLRATTAQLTAAVDAINAALALKANVDAVTTALQNADLSARQIAQAISYSGVK